MGRLRVTSASHSRFFWGLRLHLVCTVHGLPVGWALTGAKADERETLLAVLATMDQPAQDGQVVIADKNYYGAAFEAELAKGGITLIRPRRNGSCGPCARSSSPSTTPSKDSSTSRTTAPAPPPESAHASPNEPWP